MEVWWAACRWRHRKRVGIGEVEIELRAPGYSRASRGLHLEGGQYEKVVLRLEAEHVLSSPAPLGVSSGPAPLSLTKLTPATPPVASSPSTTSAPQSDETAQSASIREAAKWVSWGLGAASLGVGVFGFTRQRGALRDFDSACGVNPVGVIEMRPGSNQTADGCVDISARVDSGYRLELVGLIGAGALGAVGLVLWLTEPKRAERKTGLLSCSPGLTPETAPWLGCHFQF